MAYAFNVVCAIFISDKCGQLNTLTTMSLPMLGMVSQCGSSWMRRCCCNCASAGGALGAAGTAGGASKSIADRLITMMSKKISDTIAERMICVFVIASKHDKHGAQSDGCPRHANLSKCAASAGPLHSAEFRIATGRIGGSL